ncbi:hypothetical protein ZWY2020_037228 [Hordeum vulgare]|nr:hypothetical protein ZWY2020_037228 [Hordeum vulgare]
MSASVQRLAHRISTSRKALSANDKVFTKIRLVPIRHGDPAVDMGAVAAKGRTGDVRPKPASFANTLAQSDANNGGGFSDPLFCTKTIFPALDYSSEPTVQSIVVRDVHGDDFKFLNIYRGTPLRHLLTTGWSNLVNQKKLLAGDSIVFLLGGKVISRTGDDVGCFLQRRQPQPLRKSVLGEEELTVQAQ